MCVAVVALNDVGIPDPQRAMKMYPHEFSGGMRQRAMIAMALACQPKLLLADEPTTSLDVTIQQQILRLLKQLQHSRGMGVMLISHDLGIVAETADVVCVMYAGRVVEYANVFDLFARAYHPYTRGLLGSVPRLTERKRRLRTVSEFVEDPREFRKLPGSAMGIVPWWPTMSAPDDLAVARSDEQRAYYLYEIEPNHWVGCWRTKYLAEHPTRPPDIEFRRAP
jgi:ABC-type dipeptide/oligopeptide/nickel transport system ATPase component